MQIQLTSVRLVRLNFGLSLYLDRTFRQPFAEPKLRSKTEVSTQRKAEGWFDRMSSPSSNDKILLRQSSLKPVI